MIVVLEGPDGAGKSTLAEYFKAKDWQIVHNDKPQPGEDLFARFNEQLIEAVGSNKSTVFDRFYLSEPIYSEVMERECRLSQEDYNLFNTLITLHKVKVIILLPPFDVCKKAWSARLEAEYV